MSNFKIFYNQIVNSVRMFLIIKLVGKKFKVVANITITSDIIEYNKGLDISRGVYVKKVSSRQSFVYNPTATQQVGPGDIDPERLAIAEAKSNYINSNNT